MNEVLRCTKMNQMRCYLLRSETQIKEFAAMSARDSGTEPQNSISF